MTKQDIYRELQDGKLASKRSYTKWRYKKIVRGSFYEYFIGDTKITERQFEEIRNDLTFHSNNGLTETFYKLNHEQQTTTNHLPSL